MAAGTKRKKIKAEHIRQEAKFLSSAIELQYKYKVDIIKDKDRTEVKIE